MRVVLALARARGAAAVGRPRIIIVLRVRVTKADSKTGKAHNRFLAMPNVAPDFFQHVLHLNPTK